MEHICRKSQQDDTQKRSQALKEIIQQKNDFSSFVTSTYKCFSLQMFLDNILPPWWVHFTVCVYLGLKLKKECVLNI